MSASSEADPGNAPPIRRPADDRSLAPDRCPRGIRVVIDALRVVGAQSTPQSNHTRRKAPLSATCRPLRLWTPALLALNLSTFIPRPRSLPPPLPETGQMRRILLLPLLLLLVLMPTTTASGAGRPLERAEAASWTWPLAPSPRVLSPFRPPPQPWKPGHRGVDLLAEPDQQVRSPAAGTVRFAGTVAGRPVLSIEHPGGLVSSFEPVVSELRRGASVSQGQAVGTVRGGAHCSRTCLHWGVFRLPGGADPPETENSPPSHGREYLDPLVFVGADSRPSVLLPVRRSPRPR